MINGALAFMLFAFACGHTALVVCFVHDGLQSRAERIGVSVVTVAALIDMAAALKLAFWPWF